MNQARRTEGARTAQTVPPLVGRAEEVRALARAVAETGDGPRVVEITGEPGIGKTRLLAELGRLTVEAGLCTLTGRATEFESGLPLVLVADALAGAAPEVLAAALARLDPAERARAHAVLSGPGAPGGRVGAAGRYLDFRTLCRLLESLAMPSGVALLLDDVHWIDPDSGDFLAHLLRRPPRGRVLLAVAYRTGRLPWGLGAALATEDAARLREGYRLPLGPLGVEDVERLLGAEADRGRARRLHRSSGGNPLYLQALSGSPALDGSALDGSALGLPQPQSATLVDLPPQFRAVVAAELAAADGDVRRVASAASICGVDVEPSLLAAVVELPTGQVLAGLDDLVGRGVLHPVAGTGRFRFRHPLVQQVVYDLTPAGWRVGGHARAAGHLQRIGSPARARAVHVVRSASPGDPAAIGTLVQAAREVGDRSPATAADWLLAAVHLLPAGVADQALPDRAELVVELAARQTASGRLAEAREILGAALADVVPAGHPARSEAVFTTALLLRMLGRYTEARSVLADELARMPDPAAPDALLMALRLASHDLLRSRLGTADELLCQVVEHGGSSAPAMIAGALRRMTGAAVGPTGSDPAGTARSAVPRAADDEAAAALLDTLPDEDVARHLDLFAWLSWTSVYASGPRASLRRVERCRRIAEAGGALDVPAVPARLPGLRTGPAGPGRRGAGDRRRRGRGGAVAGGSGAAGPDPGRPVLAARVCRCRVAGGGGRTSRGRRC